MGIVFRQSIKSTIVIFFGAFLGAICNFVYPYILSNTEFGFFTTIIYVGAMLQLFMMLGMGTTIQIFTQKYAQDDERRKVLFTAGSLVTFITTIVFSLGYVLLKTPIIALYQPENQPLVREYFYYVPILLLLMSFMSLFETYLVSQAKTAISAFAREVLLRIVNLGLLGLLFYHFISFESFIAGSILVYIIPVIILYFIAARTKGFGYSFSFKAFSKDEYKEIRKFAWYHLLLGMSWNVMGYIDTLLLGILDKDGMAAVAPYRIACFVISVMIIPYRAMAVSSHSTLNQAYIDNDTSRLRELFKRAGINILIVAVGMFILIACNLDNGVAILPQGKNYEIIKPIVFILMLGRLVDMATGLNNELIGLSKFFRFNFRISIVLLVLVVALNYLFIPSYGIYGAAWATTLAFAIYNIGKSVFLWLKMDLHPLTRGSAYVLLAGTIAGAAGYLLPSISFGVFSFSKYINPLADCCIRSLLIVVVYTVMLLVLNPSADIRAFLNTIRSKKRLY